ncbi:MAG: sulfite exporter TauE/SafE family protein [Polyangiaceae bacterium]
MGSIAPAAVLGFLVGLRHAMDADHVAAVGAIVARERSVRGAAVVGAAWGLGHTASLLVLGGAIVAFGLVVPRNVGLALEMGVGVMLLALGAWNFLSRDRHSHSHAPTALLSGDRRSHRRALRPLLVGSVHGLAGSAAAALLVVAAAGSASWGFAYLLVFGAGTMVGMVVLTTALAVPMGRALARFQRAETWVRVASGALSLVVGALVVYQIGFRDGLFFQ